MPKNTQTTAQLHSSQYQYHTSSVAQSWPTLCNPINHHSTPVLPVHHQLPEFTKTRPLSQWCHPTISSSTAPFSSCLQSFPASGCFLMSQFFKSGGQSIGASASASVPSMHIQDCNYDITKTLVAYGFLSLNLKDFFIYLISCFTLIF